MKIKFLVLTFAFLFVFSGMRAESEITIGVMQHDISDIDKSFQELHELGFGSCQLNYQKGMNKTFAEKVKVASKKYQIKVTTVVAVPGRSVWNFKEGPATIGLVPKEGREEKIRIYKDMIDFCVMANVPAMHSHFGFIPEDPSSEKYKDFIQVMKNLANYAKERDIMIYFETGQETPTTLIRAIHDIGTGNVFINCDLANLVMYGKANALDAVRQFGSLIKEFHAKDGKYPTDPYRLGEEVSIPEGEVDFPAIITLLKKENFQGSLTIERELGGDQREYIIRTKEYLQSLLK